MEFEKVVEQQISRIILFSSLKSWLSKVEKFMLCLVHCQKPVVITLKHFEYLIVPLIH